MVRYGVTIYIITKLIKGYPNIMRIYNVKECTNTTGIHEGEHTLDIDSNILL